MFAFSLNLAYWGMSLFQLSFAYVVIPNIAPYMVLSVIGFGIYVSYLTVKIYGR